MNVFSFDKDLHAFLNVMSTRKSNFSNLAYLHLSLDPTKEAPRDMPRAELTQFLSFFFPKEGLVIFFMNEKDGLLLVTSKDNALGVNAFEKALQESLPDLSFRVEMRGFDVLGLDTFIKMVEPYIPSGDQIGRTLLARMRRLRNCIMVLDDDKMVTHQVEKLVTAAGLVVPLNNPNELLVQYAQYAPDILFLDIHLRTAKGNELLRDLLKTVDPYAHVVMISSDTEERTVLDIKAAGAKGFIVKPFTRQGLMQHLSRAPTFVSAAAVR